MLAFVLYLIGAIEFVATAYLVGLGFQSLNNPIELADLGSLSWEVGTIYFASAFGTFVGGITSIALGSLLETVGRIRHHLLRNGEHLDEEEQTTSPRTTRREPRLGR